MNEKHRYMFVFSDESTYDTLNEVDIKDAVLALFGDCDGYGPSYNTLSCAIRGMNPETELKEMIKLLNMFLYTEVTEIYIISERIY